MYSTVHQEALSAYSELSCKSPEQLVHQYLPLVKRITSRVVNQVGQPIPREDMEQAGLMGLWEAVTRIDTLQSEQFERIASLRIRGAIIDELRRNDWRPRPLQKRVQQIRDTIARLSSRDGQPPSEQQVANELLISLDEYHRILNDIQASQLMSFVPEMFEQEQPESLDPLIEQLSSQQEKQNLVKALQLLPEREQMLLHFHYNLDLNLSEIAQIFEVGRARACQLHKQALLRLRSVWQEYN